MAKMYYSEEEACQTLGVDNDGLMGLVNNARLQMYQDGAKHVFKSGDVDELAISLAAEGTNLNIGDSNDHAALEGPSEADGEVLLSGLDAHIDNKDQFSKEDTVITAEGISIFDDEDLEIGEADPMAKTQIAPSLDDQIALDGVGSGSGLLDLTRESDDTSLGAEVLDHIDMEGSGLTSGLGSGLMGGSTVGGTAMTGQVVAAMGTSMGAAIGSGMGSMGDSNLSGSGMGIGAVDNLSSLAPPAAPQQAAPATYAPAPTEPPTFVEATDAMSGLFSGLIVGATITMFVALIATLSAQQEIVPKMLSALQTNLSVVLVGVIAVTIIAAVLGLLLGKTAAASRRPAKRLG